MAGSTKWAGSRVGLPLLGTCALIISACEVSGEEEAEAVGSNEAPLYALSTKLWDRGAQIEVCWKPGASAADKALVQDAVTRSWQSRANISFVGWGACPASGFAGIEITPGNANVVTGGLGNQSDGISNMELDLSAAPQNTWSRCVNNSLTRSECIRATATHEFGHSLGFAHEQNRPDNAGACTIGVGSGSSGDTLLGPFDNLSIMSYCGNATQLSPTDVYGANVVYGIAPALLSAFL